MNTNKLKLSLLLSLCCCVATGIAHEYSQKNIDFYLSSCAASGFISQETCECAIQYIQNNLAEKEYETMLANPFEVKPEVMEVLTNALSADCSNPE